MGINQKGYFGTNGLLQQNFKALILAAWLACLSITTGQCAPAKVQAPSFLVQPRHNIVVLGDSITAGGEYGQIMQDLMDERFPERQIRVLSRGVHGDTVQGALQRLEVDVVPWRPDWVVINFGINDAGGFTPEQFRFHYEALINRILQDTRARPVIVSPVYPDRDEENPRLREYAATLRELAKRYDAVYVPAYETMRALRPSLPAEVKYAPDGIHPNWIGHWIIAQSILRELRFPLPATPRALPVPARQASAGQSDALAGREFVLRLPQPMRVRLTAPALPRAKVLRAAKPVVVDGKLDEWEQKSPLMLERPDQRVWGVMSWKRDRLRARVFPAYDGEAFYLAIAVDDAVVRSPDNPPLIVSRDCIEICLDLRSAPERAANPAANFSGDPTAPILQFIVPAPGAKAPAVAVLKGNGNPALLEGVTAAATRSATGYNIEMRVPAKHFPGGVITPDTTIGFDCAVVNVDRNDRYYEATSLRWTGSTLSSFSTREFGSLTFAGEKAATANAATAISPLHNTFARLTTDKRLKIVVVGNSVTNGGASPTSRGISFYETMRSWFEQRFPDAKIELKTAIIFAIGPDMQLFRMDANTLAEKPDLVLAEFAAANGAWGEAGRHITEPATEGYIRRLRQKLPQADLMLNMALFQTMLDDYGKKQTPPAISFQQQLARHYNFAVSDSAGVLAKRILSGEPYETYMDDVIHPNARGYQVHGETLVAELERQYALFLQTTAARRAQPRVLSHALPATTLHAAPWMEPRVVPASEAAVNGFEPQASGPLRYIAATKPGASGVLNLKSGRAVGLWLRSMAPLGVLEVRLDGQGNWVRLAGKSEPRFTEQSDSTNWIERRFFGYYGLPLSGRKIEFRVVADDDGKNAAEMEIVGFFVVDE